MKKNLWGERSLVFGISLLLIGIGFFPSNDDITSSKKIQGSIRDSPPPVEWNQTYQSLVGYSGGNCIQETPDGGYIITGYAGWGAYYSFYLLKIDAQGNEEWNRTFGSGYTEANWVEVTADNGYILTGRDCKWIEEQEAWVEDIWVIKTDEYGYEEWNWTRLTLYNDWGTCIKQTSDGGFIANDIAVSETYNFSLLKFDANGNILWETTYENRWGISFTLTPNDDIILTGLGQYALLLMKTDKNGSMEWEQEFFQDLWPDCRGNDVHTTPDGGYIIGGSTSTYSSSDLLLLKTNENGVEQWHQTYGFSGTDLGTSVALLDNGDYVLGGTHFGLQGVAPDRFWLLRTTPAGNVIWSQYYLPLESARCSCVQQTSENGVIASGAINVYTGATCVVVKLSNHTGNQPPYTPSNPNPPDGIIDVEVNATLCWIGSDPNPDDILTYDVYFGMNNTPAKMVSNQTELMYCPGTMEYSTTYYWRIVAWDTGNEFTAGPLWHFSTITDTTPPVTTITLSGSIGDNNWYVSPVTITLTAFDSQSAVNITIYKVDNGNWMNYTAPFVLANDGYHTVTYYSIDNIGNMETEKNMTLTIDQITPVTIHSLSGTPGNNDWYITSGNITINALDNTSGVNHTYLKIDNGDYEEYTAPLIFTSEGIHTFQYFSKDNAGNQETINGPFTIKIDSTSPSITLSKQKISFNQVKFTAEVSDETSGIDRVEFALDGLMQSNDTQSPYEWTYTGIGNHQVTATAFDIAGNSQSQSMSTPYELIQGIQFQIFLKILKQNLN